MYNAIFFKPNFKYGLYNSFVEGFSLEFGLIERKRKNKIYFLENENMKITVRPKYVEVLLDEKSDKVLENRIREYFNRQ